MDLSKYDFIDFGASTGGSISWAEKNLGGRGIGVDIAPGKIKKLEAAGHSGFVADATNLQLPDGIFRYATAMNFLEHLPNAEIGEAVIRQAVRVAQEFVVILGPNFDNLEYLKSIGVKKYFADWSGHQWHHTVKEFSSIFSRTGFNYSIVQFDKISSTNHEALLPLSSPRNRGIYVPATDLPKPAVKLDQSVYTWIAAVICKNPDLDINEILLKITGAKIISYKSSQKGPSVGKLAAV